MLKIRKAVPEDFERILEIYAYAREVMKNSGNPDQWGDFQPSRELVEYDISVSRAYVMEEEKIHGVFVIIEGDDPLYKSIDGRWLDDGDYISVHRIASDGEVHGIFDSAISYAKEKYPCIRIDTYRDNRIMQRLLEKSGFTYCGIVKEEDGDPRREWQYVGLAYEWVRK